MERDERGRADALDRHWDALRPVRPRLPRPTSTPTCCRRPVARSRGAIPTLFPDPDQAWRELRQVSTPAAVSGSGGRQRPGMAVSEWPCPCISSHDGWNPSPRASESAGAHPAGDSRPAAADTGSRSRRSGSACRRRMRGGGCQRWCAPPSRPPGGIVDTPLVETSFCPRSFPAVRSKPPTTGSPHPSRRQPALLGGLFCKRSRHIGGCWGRGRASRRIHPSPRGATEGAA